MNPSAIPMLCYGWLLFDADGTLFDFDRAERAAIEQALARIGVTFDPGSGYLPANQPGPVAEGRKGRAHASEETGAAKPAQAFFDTAFARLGYPSKREVLMIGDGWASDIQGAVQYGIDACWYNPGRKPRPGSHEITRDIGSLRELTDWLGLSAPG